MDDKTKAIIKFTIEIKSPHHQEVAQFEQIKSILNAYPIEITEDDISRLFGTPLAICES